MKKETKLEKLKIRTSLFLKIHTPEAEKWQGIEMPKILLEKFILFNDQR